MSRKIMPLKKVNLISFFIFFDLILVSCSNSKSNTLSNIKDDCIKIHIGKVALCLPEVKGMVECYNEEKIKMRVDEYKLESNTIHGYYLSDSLYKIIDGLQNISMSDCFKVWSVNASQNLQIIPQQLDEIFEVMTNDYTKIILDSAAVDFSRKFEPISIGKPAIIKVYQPQPNIKTAITISKIGIADKVSFSLATISLVVVKERLLFYSYYLNYGGIGDIETAKYRNDKYGLRLTELNN